MKTALKLGTVVSTHKHRFPPLSYNPIIQKISSSPTMQRRGRHRFDPLRKRVDGNKQIAITFLICWERTSGIDAPTSKRNGALVDPTNRLLGSSEWTLLLAGRTSAHAVCYVQMHSRPPKRKTQSFVKLIPTTMSQRVMRIHQQSFPGNQRWNIDPALGLGGRGWKSNLELIAVRSVELSEVLQAIGLVRVCG